MDGRYFLPDIFHQIKLKLLPKKGHLSDPNKWRGIALLDICSKIISSIIANRFEKHYRTFANEAQCGSLQKKGCADANFSVNLSLQTIREHGESTYCIFVDLIKAYDTVNRELLWKILTRYGVPNVIIKILKKLYNNPIIFLSEKTSFKATCWVKQGDNLPPILFVILFNAVTETLEKKWTFAKPDFCWMANTKTPIKQEDSLRI